LQPVRARVGVGLLAVDKTGEAFFKARVLGGQAGEKSGGKEGARQARCSADSDTPFVLHNRAVPQSFMPNFHGAQTVPRMGVRWVSDTHLTPSEYQESTTSQRTAQLVAEICFSTGVRHLSDTRLTPVTLRPELPQPCLRPYLTIVD